MTETLHIGQRLQLGSDRATVRYIGQVDGQSGDWVGLEWDNAARGKHDGSLNGIRYFACIRAENAGTFVRMTKLLQSAQLGATVLQGLQSRYQGADLPASGTAGYSLAGEKDVRERQGQLQLLTKASLSGDCISTSGPDGELAAAVPALAELDLSGCMLDSWDTALNIMAQLPALQLLDLSLMRMALPLTQQPPPALVISHLHTLVLNSCSLTWHQVTVLGANVPNLKELHVCSNLIASLTVGDDLHPAPRFSHLQTLDLADNQLASWDEVRHLSSLSALTLLNLSNNRLPDATEGLCSGTPFGALQALICANNQIASWDTIQSIAELPSLADLRLTGNPLFDTRDADRSEVIARVPGLTLLNGSIVDARERRDAELHYLRSLLTEAESKPGSLKELQAKHPRLTALQQKYGEMSGIAAQPTRHLTGSEPMCAHMINLHLVRDTNDAEEIAKSRKIPGVMTLGDLKWLAQQLLHINMYEQHLLLQEPGSEQLRSLADEHDSERLADLEIKDGARVLVRLHQWDMDQVARLQYLNSLITEE